MTSERVIEDQTVLTAGSTIIATDDFDEIHIPKNAQLTGGDSAYLVPGLADMHMHTWADWEDRGI
jgi:imidazolonepropionase-like amidohydrolase